MDLVLADGLAGVAAAAVAVGVPLLVGDLHAVGELAALAPGARAPVAVLLDDHEVRTLRRRRLRVDEALHVRVEVDELAVLGFDLHGSSRWVEVLVNEKRTSHDGPNVLRICCSSASSSLLTPWPWS